MKRLTGAAALILFALMFPSTSQARSQQPYGINLGGQFYDGFGPREPGLTYLFHGIGSFARRINDQQGNRQAIFNKPQIDTYVLINQLYFNTPLRLFNGAANLGLDFLLPFVVLDSSFAPPPPEPGVRLTDNGVGLGDLVFGPALQFRPVMARTGRPLFSSRVEFDLMVPTGKYDPRRDINQSSNFVSLIAYWAFTFLPLARWEISGRLHYMYNARNWRPSGLPPSEDAARVANVVPGQAVWLNFASSVRVVGPLSIGVNGYYFQQLNEDVYKAFDGSRIAPALVQGNGLSSWRAIGPGVFCDLGRGSSVAVNLYFQTAAKGREQNKSVALNYIHPF